MSVEGASPFSVADVFANRHIAPSDADIGTMLAAIGAPSLDALIDETVPGSIRLRRPLDLPAALTEHAVLEELRAIAAQNTVTKAFIGTGYSDTVTPPVILRNILENPAWYTAYTPYQPEIAQGRLEALLNFQTMVIDLTAMEIANASLLDEGTAAAEGMAMAARLRGDHEDASKPRRFFCADHCHPQTIEVLKGRAEPLGIEVEVGAPAGIDWSRGYFGALVQVPTTEGLLLDVRAFIDAAHGAGALVIVATDLLALTLMTPPGEMGADIVVGTAQRLGVPLGYGGPHAAFLATRSGFARSMPGRLIGVTEDAQGHRALRMALQTREQHIRREKATSNVCTAQVLLAVIASMYGVYHGPSGMTAIARRIHAHARELARRLVAQGSALRHTEFFDTIVVETGAETAAVWSAARQRGMTLRVLGGSAIGISVDETTSLVDVDALIACFAVRPPAGSRLPAAWSASLVRQSAFMTHQVFHSHQSEAEMVRYIKHLESKDFSLVHGMIPLGSCTMKLNATAEMLPVTWPGFGRMHPFAPKEDARGYARLVADLERWLCEITGFAAVSVQPNAGSQGELAGMLVIRAYHRERGEPHRDVVLIPQSAHGTNPASAVMAGLRVVVVKTDSRGNIDVADLKTKASEHAAALAALMVTYPSTHGVFEADIKEICAVIHANGGQVYMDGANMNAQVGLCRPCDIGADVCHLNLHKTFCIPHGGGGPGVGPIGVAAHLAQYLPGNPVVATGGSRAIPAISAAPFGSASILVISWAYIRMMGAAGLKRATEVAILHANYVATRLQSAYPVLYRGERERVAHECILDLRPLKASSGVEAEDVAKRLMDYGFHAPTLSFPVAGTLMVEPTESEPLGELDRFCEAMLAIRAEIAAVENGTAPRDDNVLKHAPHTMHVVTADAWSRPYSRQSAAFPVPRLRSHKFWPSVGRVNSVLGDRKLVCACPPTEDYA